MASFALAAASVIIAFAGTIVVTERRGDQGSYLDEAFKLAKSIEGRSFDDASKFAQSLMPAAAPSRTVEASAPVPGAQSLRTTSDANQNRLTAAAPTGGPETSGAPVKEPVVTRAANSAPRPSLPAAQAPVQAKAVDPTPTSAPVPKVEPIAAPPTSAPAQTSTVTPVSPTVAPALPSIVTLVPPPKQEAAISPPPAELRTSNSDRMLASADLEQLMRRGDQLLAAGDIIAARHYFELVTEAGDMRAALRLGKTYDPAFLQQNGVRGTIGDPAMAKSWYLKAIAAGDKGADMQLLQLMTLYPN